jgi:hypothetical protein
MIPTTWYHTAFEVSFPANNLFTRIPPARQDAQAEYILSIIEPYA